jgi:hypothetical protein
VRTKTLETVKTRGTCWQLMTVRDHTHVQFTGYVRLLVATSDISRPELEPIYGSEGWGFESLRARSKSQFRPPPSFSSIDAGTP